jgi:hypothetical protein
MLRSRLCHCPGDQWQHPDLALLRLQLWTLCSHLALQDLWTLCKGLFGEVSLCQERGHLRLNGSSHHKTAIPCWCGKHYSDNVHRKRPLHLLSSIFRTDLLLCMNPCARVVLPHPTPWGWVLRTYCNTSKCTNTRQTMPRRWIETKPSPKGLDGGELPLHKGSCRGVDPWHRLACVCAF